MLVTIFLTLVGVAGIAILFLKPYFHGGGPSRALPVPGLRTAGKLQGSFPLPANPQPVLDAVAHLQTRLDLATTAHEVLKATITRLEQEKTVLHAKYLEKVKSSEEKKRKLDAWRKKQSDTRKGLSDQAAEIVNQKDKWLPHGREERAGTGKRGKHEGSAGGGWARPEKIHYQKHVRPSRCPHCGGSLEGAREKKPYSHVVIELENLQADPKDYRQWTLRNIEFLHHGVWCAQCRKWVYHDLGALKWVHYGLNFVIYVISKRIATRMPFEMLIWELADQFGPALALKAPTIVGWFRQHEEVLKEVYEQLKTIAQAQGFNHIDETGLPLRGENWWVWVVCNAHFALFFESRTRGYAAVEDLLRDYDGSLIADCWSAYGRAEQEQQKCLGHLVTSTNEVIVARQKENTRIARECERARAAGADASNNSRVIPSPVNPLPATASPAGEKRKRGRPRKASKLSPGDIAKLETVARENGKVIQQATRLKEFLGGAWKEGSPLCYKAPEDQRLSQVEAEQQLAGLVQALRAEGPPDPELRKILERCEKYRGQWFTYLDHPGMPPDNNQAERDLRSWAVQRKVSGSFQNEKVVHSYLTYKSLFVTCQKNDKDFRDLLQQLLGRQKVDLLDFFFSNDARKAELLPAA